MLVLSRRLNESIVVGNDIVITVLEIRGDQVRIGIDAPRSVTVHRQEIYAELVRANRDASAANSDDVPKLPRPPG